MEPSIPHGHAIKAVPISAISVHQSQLKMSSGRSKIVGYNLVLSTSVEIHLKIELPVAVTNISGNAEEGSQLIENKKQIHNHHKAQVKIDIADAKYDIINNYNYIRGKGSIPIIDYNPRNEDLSQKA